MSNDLICGCIAAVYYITLHIMLILPQSIRILQLLCRLLYTDKIYAANNKPIHHKEQSVWKPYYYQLRKNYSTWSIQLWQFTGLTIAINAFL